MGDTHSLRRRDSKLLVHVLVLVEGLGLDAIVLSTLIHGLLGWVCDDDTIVDVRTDVDVVVVDLRWLALLDVE
jgi:hypothetical protein